MHALIILGMVLIVLAIIVWTFGIHLIEEDVSIFLFVFSIIFFAFSVYCLYLGVKKQTSEEVLKYLTKQGVTELVITNSDNELEYRLTPEADSTDWRPLYFYLTERAK